MEPILVKLKETVNHADATTRQALLSQLQALQLELERPDDTIKRVMFLNCQMALVRVGIDLKIFNVLTESKGDSTVTEIAEKTGGDASLVGRVLRYLACTGYILEKGQDVFSGNHITACLAAPDTQAGMRHYFDFLGPIY